MCDDRIAGIGVREDLDEHLAELTDIQVTTRDGDECDFTAELDGHHLAWQVRCEGFGMPHVVGELQHRGHTIILYLYERDGYEYRWKQDGGGADRCSGLGL